MHVYQCMYTCLNACLCSSIIPKKLQPPPPPDFTKFPKEFMRMTWLLFSSNSFSVSWPLQVIYLYWPKPMNNQVQKPTLLQLFVFLLSTRVSSISDRYQYGDWPSKCKEKFRKIWTFLSQTRMCIWHSPSNHINTGRNSFCKARPRLSSFVLFHEALEENILK